MNPMTPQTPQATTPAVTPQATPAAMPVPQDYQALLDKFDRLSSRLNPAAPNGSGLISNPQGQ
jgi:hypothetical protein